MRLDCIPSPFGQLCQLGIRKEWNAFSLHSPPYIPQFTSVRELDSPKIEQYYRFSYRRSAFGDKRRNGSWNSDSGSTGRGKFKRSPYIDDSNDDGYDDSKPWWTFPDEEDYYDEREDYDDSEEASDSELSWSSVGVQKAFRSLTWIFPAVLIPFLLGNPMGLVMALVLPFAQTAIGTLFQQAWKAIMNTVSPAPAKPKRQRKTASYRNRTRPDTVYSNPMEEMSSEQYAPYNDGEAQPDASGSTPPETRREFSWADPDESRKDGQPGGLNLGGWEDLDNGIQSPAITVKQKKMGKLSRRVRKREVPLLFRLLVALFPFLGVWGKYL